MLEKNTPLFLKALYGNNHEGPPPVWIMRQAGRYLPEYRALRERYSLKELFETVDLAIEVTLQPIKRFGFDAAILFSDIMVIAKSLGLKLDFPKGPLITPEITSSKELALLRPLTMEESLREVAEVIRGCKKELLVPLIGFCGGPFTVVSYLIGDLKRTKRWLYEDPESFYRFLDLVTDQSIAYLKMQVLAGVDAIQIFDSWANVLTREQFLVVCAPYLKRIVEALAPTPVILFLRGACLFVDELVPIAPRAISFDWQRPLSEMRKRIPKEMAIQGNLDPDILYAPLEQIDRIVEQNIDSMGQDPGWILNLGHGIHPDVEVSSVARMVTRVREYARDSRRAFI